MQNSRARSRSRSFSTRDSAPRLSRDPSILGLRFSLASLPSQQSFEAFAYLHAKLLLLSCSGNGGLLCHSLPWLLSFCFFYPCSWPVSTLVLILLSSFFLSFFCFWNCEIRANLLRVLLFWSICRGSAAAMEIPERNKSKLRGPKTYEEEPRRDPSLQINSKVRDWDRTLRQLLFPVNFFVSFQGKMCRHWGFCLYSQRILALQLPAWLYMYSSETAGVSSSLLGLYITWENDCPWWLCGIF